MDEARMTQQAMATWGRLAQSEIAGDLAAFAALGLGEGERLSAIAGLAAAAAMKRHAPHPARFLARLQQLTRPSSFTAAAGADGSLLRDARIAAGLRLLDAAFDRLSARLADSRAEAAEAGAVEAVLLARLLAAHRPHRVRLALLAAAAGLASPHYRPGDRVPFVPVEGGPDAAAAPHAVALAG